MSKFLTKRKQAWVQRRKPDVINGGIITPSAAIASRYQSKLDAMITRMADDVERELKKFFKKEYVEEYFAQDASTSAQAKILTDELMKRFNFMFADKSKATAWSFANQADKSSSSQTHASLKELSGGLSLPTANLDGPLKDILNATITENVNLIKTISQQYLSGVQQAVMRSITTGNGMQDLIPYLQRSREITYRRARMIAYDQTRKATNNMTKARLENLGMKKFKWLHTGGSDHPRPLHIKMSGNIYSFDDLPVIDEKTGERGIPGQAINCRCRMQMVISFDN